MSLKILILTDGKMGDLMQCRGVAEALTDSTNITEQVINPDFLHSLPLPYMTVQSSDKEGKRGSPFEHPFPDIVIASGRRTAPYLRHFKRLRGSEKKPFTVFLKDPQLNRAEIDFIWTPTHDNLSGENIFSTPTSPHTLSKARLKQAKKVHRFDGFESPCAGIILGGNSKSLVWSEDTIASYAKCLSHMPLETSILITASRRTPDALKSAVVDAFRNHKTWSWDSYGENPYMEILAHADRLIITGDSHNMVSEALATGKPVHVFQPPGLQKKLVSFLDGLEQGGLIEDATNGFERTTSKPIDATPIIAAEVMKRFKA